MPKFSTAVIDAAIDVERRLTDFGLTVSQLLAIRDSARAAASDASPLMPLNAPGTLAYIYGVDALRTQLLGSNWQLDRTLGIEAVVDDEQGIRIAYQNVDRACDPQFPPMPRSAKGPASERLCCFPLFEHYGIALEQDKERLPAGDVNDRPDGGITTYFVMVGEDGSVELSCPIITKQRFVDFRERIFIDRSADDWDTRIEPDLSPVQEFDVAVSLKENR